MGEGGEVSLLQLSPFFASIFPLLPQKRLILKLTPVCTKNLVSWDTDGSSLHGGFPYERGGDARRLD